MTFADLIAGDSVFVDANILIYYFGPHPVFGAACQPLIQRIENRELLGFASIHVLAEMAHQLMILEASGLPGWSSGKVAHRLRQQPAAVQGLSRFRTAVESILQSQMTIASADPTLLLAAATITQQHGLLRNDALTVAIMQANGLTKIASHDADFDRVPGITRYAPA